MMSIFDPKDEWDRMANIYYYHEWTTTDRRPYLDANFYSRMGRWYQSQGCEFKPLTGRQYQWQDEQARVEFWMKHS
jgi:hypothetical protein